MQSDLINGSEDIKDWIDYVKNLCNFDNIIIYDPNIENKLIQEMVDDNVLIKLNPNLRPNSYLARSSIDDVARLESRTFICTKPDNPIKPSNWMSTEQGMSELIPLFTNAMKNKTAYLVPFVMGEINDDYSIYGLMITDSPYVAVSTGIMAYTGTKVLDKIMTGVSFVKCLHCVGSNISVGSSLKWYASKTKWICHFPEENAIYSYGSGYGGNAILSKKCLALRIASYRGLKEGWYAEHMMLISLTNKRDRKTIYISGAFPSACGKTNMAMLKSKLPDWEIKTIGDDITWFRIIDGKLHAINPETGFFGVAPNTSPKTNPVCVETIKHNTIFTNVGLTSDGDIWWEGLGTKPSEIQDWQGHYGSELISHPNARFTVRANQCPQWSFDDDKKWVPISAIIFGGKRSSPAMPLIREALGFEHGVLMGATLSSEMTAAAEGPIGTLRYDPFAMLPFFGYSISNYFDHWLHMKDRLTTLPRIYYINLFSKSNGNFIWPGFSDNIYILTWIYYRIINNISAIKTPIGYIPDLNTANIINYNINIHKDFWIQQLNLDKQHLIDNNSPQILLDILDNIYHNVKLL